MLCSNEASRLLLFIVTDFLSVGTLLSLRKSILKNSSPGFNKYSYKIWSFYVKLFDKLFLHFFFINVQFSCFGNSLCCWKYQLNKFISFKFRSLFVFICYIFLILEVVLKLFVSYCYFKKTRWFNLVATKIGYGLLKRSFGKKHRNSLNNKYETWSKSQDDWLINFNGIATR